MAKDKLTDYDATASGNLDVGGVSVAEGMLPSGVNNAIRELMSHQADAFGAGAPLYVDQTNNRVGVGNAAPTVPLDVTGAASVSGALTAASATVTGDLTVDTDTLYVDSTNNQVGIGTTTSRGKLTVKTANVTASDSDFDVVGLAPEMTIAVANKTGTLLAGYDTSIFGVAIGYSYVSPGYNLIFGTNDDTSGNPTERMRIDSSGNLLVGTTNTAPATQNSDLGIAIAGSEGRIFTCTSGHHDFNRTSDGEILRFRSAANTEGSISVSGTTVSYNGGHLARWSRLTDNIKDTSIVKGTVMTNLDEMVEWSHDAVEAVEAQDAVYDDDGNVITEAVEAVEAKEAYTEDNEQLNKMAVSSVEGDANVAGVFVNWDEDDDFNDMNIAMTGDMVIRIAQGTTVARGDLLMSAGDGTAKPQGDDIIRSKTIAKVTSTHVSHTYDDGSYLVPCVLMAC